MIRSTGRCRTRRATGLAGGERQVTCLAGPFSHVIEVTFVGADPLQAAAAVNNAMDVYIKDQYAAKHRLVDTATELLQNEARDLRRQVNQGEERISTYRGEHAMSQGMHAATGNEQITNLAEDLVKAQSALAAANARLDAARGKAGAEAQAAVAPSVVQLRAQLEQARRPNAGTAQQAGQRSPRSPKPQSPVRRRRACIKSRDRPCRRFDRRGSACCLGAGNHAGRSAGSSESDGTKCRQGADPAECHDP